MWQKRRDKENMEGQSRYPLYDTGTQRRKEGGDQPQERTQEYEAERNAGCPVQEGFTIEKHRKKNAKGRRCYPKNSKRNVAERRWMKAKTRNYVSATPPFITANAENGFQNMTLIDITPAKTVAESWWNVDRRADAVSVWNQMKKLNVQSVIHAVVQKGRTLAPKRSDWIIKRVYNIMLYLSF